MAKDDYIAGFRFENLIKKVLPARSVQAHKSLLKNALSMENGETHAKQSGSTKKQFLATQKKLIEVLEKLQSKSPYKKEATFFDILSIKADQCSSVQCLSEITEEALLKASSLDNSGNWKN